MKLDNMQPEEEAHSTDAEQVNSSDNAQEQEETHVEPPEEFICSLTMDLMSDPVMSKYGHSYERSAIFKWIARGNDTCPMSRRPLRLSDLITNHALRCKIRRWQLENQENITVIVNDTSSNMFLSEHLGFFTVSGAAEGDPDPTERLEDDAVNIAEHRPHRSRRHRSGRSSAVEANGPGNASSARFPSQSARNVPTTCRSGLAS